MIRMAIVGIGWAGTKQAEAVRELDRDIAVYCLVDSDRDHLAAKASELGIDKTYTDYDRALADPHIDAVSICTPHRLHCDYAVRAAGYGKHVLCEKPMATTVEEATRMIKAAEDAGVRLYVAENASYSPKARFLREVIANGDRIGEVVAATVVNGFRGVPYGYPARREWLAKPELGGTGTWMLHGIHSMAQLRFVFGEVETVYMTENRAQSFGRNDIEGTMHGLLRMAGGYTISVIQTCEVRLKQDLKRYVIHGDRGSIWARDEGCRVYAGDDGGDPYRDVAYPQSPLSEYAMELAAFAEYVSAGTEGPTTGVSERRSLAVVQAGYESVQTGAPVHIRHRFGDI